MATWNITRSITECDKCGRKYNTVRYEQPIREKGHFNCYCGNPLLSWNGGVDYTFTEVEDPS